MTITCVLLLYFGHFSTAIPDGLATRPPMGWTSWNTFFENNSESKMMSQADALIELGLDKYGYTTLTIDDYWQLPEREETTGRMIEDPDKFPNGIKYLSDYFHSLGLNIGMYSSAGRYTCSGNLPGSLGYEATDVEMLVEYDIDYFKYDNCYPKMDGTTNTGTGVNIDFEASVEHYPSLWQDPSEQSRYAPMAEALAAAKSSRNITFELCAWGFGNVETFGASMGHVWRTSQDITDTWRGMLWNIDVNDEPRYRQAGVQGPEVGGWNYPDGLFVGKGGMTDTEYRSMFALWCLAKAPLMLGADLRTITRESAAYATITNPGLLAVNQDPLGVQGECVKDCCSHGSTGGLTSPETCFHFSHSWQVWAGPLSHGSWVVVVVNRHDKEESISMNWETDAKVPVGTYTVENLWLGEELEGEIVVGGEEWEGFEFRGILPAHDNWAFKLSPVEEAK